MKLESFVRHHGARRAMSAGATIASAIVALSGAMCSGASSSMSSGPAPAMDMSTSPPRPDPRVGLRAGTTAIWSKDTTKRIIVDRAAETAWNMRLVSNSPASEQFVGVTNSDLAFTGDYAIQGNYNGYQVWDISNRSRPVLKTAYY
jgi:hypothetical protein